MSALPPKADIGSIPAEGARPPGPRSEVVTEVGRAARSSRLEPAHRRPGFGLSVSTCAAKVRASLLKARSALSCCGILTDREIFDSARTENRSTASFYFLGKSDAHLYRLVRESTPGSGDFDDMA